MSEFDIRDDLINYLAVLHLKIISIKGINLLHFDDIAERSQPAMMALPPFCFYIKDMG